MNDFNGIVAIITSVLGATWYLSGKLSKLETKVEELQAQDTKHASKESYETLIGAVKALHARVLKLEALIAKKA